MGLPILRRPAGFRRVVRGGAQTPHQRQGAAGPSSLPPIEPDPMGRLSASRWTTWSRSTVSPPKGLPDPPFLLSLSEQIFGLAARFHLHLSARFLPGVENVWADALSRFRARRFEWQLHPERFAALCRRWGTPEVDPLCVPPALPNYRPF
ncbi:hypothetical protein GWK47_054099 [Chionoecetes opilio]|uniref:Uncharacterized protein n=1 Tax=Chionoecetes opilio TaxID=41210 RepID=A0A8J4Y0G7_CHIOP|nr:hypothetical protein GWK47_054099 [Chionoecetes opilio]